MSRAVDKSAVFRISVEEENLASIPFAVLESRVGKRINKLEIRGTKMLAGGQEIPVSWQVQGNPELGLPTEQDLDIFVALGVLTFRNNFAKTVTFTGRELAKILGIRSVHGKFYQRLKIAMDRFVPLRFRAIAATDRQEEVKWLNVFQEASFTLDRISGRCTGTVTWTDKLIQSMNSGFFRLLDAGRYMDLDGITVKHMYRFLAVAFEKSDIVILDARKLATEHLGIVKLPKYFSRLMQTLEPAFEQLMRIEVLGSYHITNSDDWEIALHRHHHYVPERKTLLLQDDALNPARMRETAYHALAEAGMEAAAAQRHSGGAVDFAACYQMQRAANLLRGLADTGVLPHVAVDVIEKALAAGVDDVGRDQLDWCEIALDLCQHKLHSGQRLKNPAGFVMRLLRDAEARAKMVPEGKAAAAKAQFRQREQRVFTERHQMEQRELVLEYETFCSTLGRTLLEDLPDTARQSLRADKAELLRQQGRYERMDVSTRELEIEHLIVTELAKREAPPFEKWLLRKRAAQAMLPFEIADTAMHPAAVQ